MMKNRWLGKNVDPLMLQGCIEDFFQRRGFVTKTESEASGGYTVIAHGHNSTNTPRRIFVKVSGGRGDFEIDLGSEYGRSGVLDPLLTLIGFGGLVLRKLKDKEFLEKLEEDFWSYIEEAISTLVEPSVEKG